MKRKRKEKGAFCMVHRGKISASNSILFQRHLVVILVDKII